MTASYADERQLDVLDDARPYVQAVALACERGGGRHRLDACGVPAGGACLDQECPAGGADVENAPGAGEALEITHPHASGPAQMLEALAGVQVQSIYLIAARVLVDRRDVADLGLERETAGAALHERQRRQVGARTRGAATGPACCGGGRLRGRLEGASRPIVAAAPSGSAADASTRARGRMPADDVLQDAVPDEFDVLDSPEAGGQVVRGSTMRVGAYAGGLLVGLASTPLVVRHLGVVDYGRYATVVSLMFIVTAITEGGLAALGLREFATLDAGGRAALIRNLLGLRIVLVTLASALAIVFAVAAGYTDAMVAGVVIMSGGLMVLAYQDALSLPLKAGLRLGWVSVIDFVRQFTVAALMVLLVILGASLLPFYTAIPISSAVGLVITVVLVRREVPLLPAFSMPAWVRLLRQTVLYAAASALGILYFQMALILTSVVSTPRQTGLFGVSFRIIELANGIPWLVTTSAFPVIARAAHTNLARLRYALQRMFEVGLIAGTWFMLAIVIGAPFAIAVVAGHKFDDSVTVLRILGVIPIGTFLIATWAYALLALRAYKGILISNAIAVATIGTLVPILASAHGAIGAAIAAAVTEYVLATCYAVALMRPRPEMRVSLSVAPRVLVAALAAAGIVVLLAPSSFVGVVIASVVYAGALWLLRAVPSEVIDAFMGRLRA